MDIINLPEDIFPEDKCGPGEIHFYDYVAHPSVLRGKSIMHKNAISMVLTGEKDMHFTNRTVHVKADGCHFLSAGNCVASMELAKEVPFRSILIFFDDHALANFYVKYAVQIDQAKVGLTILHEPFVEFKREVFTDSYIRSIQALLQAGKKMTIAMRLLKFEELMLHLLENHPSRFLSFQPQVQNGFDDIELRKVVETHINTPVNIEEMAFLCNVSLSTFKRRFSKIYGTSPNKWLLKQRMEIAKDLLTHHKAKPGEIYYRLGYENHSSFSKSFKQIFGLTPSAYQARQLTQMV